MPLYKKEECCVFARTTERFGGLSNMCKGFLLEVTGRTILTSEHLYQSLKFTHLPDLQDLILHTPNPFEAKQISRLNNSKVREDWDKVKKPLMYWCVRVKLACNIESFGALLDSTGELPIVEFSKKDPYWGATPVPGSYSKLKGNNYLGRVLNAVRLFRQRNLEYYQRIVNPLSVPGFHFLGEPISTVDCTEFVEYL